MRYVGNSKSAELVREYIKNRAHDDRSCCAVGEPGVGRKFCLRLIHESSRRSSEPLVCFDAARSKSPETEIFGEVKTSIFVIENISTGLIDDAGGGTLVISNPHYLSSDAQHDLAVAMAFGGFKPRGSEETLKAMCRFMFVLPPSPERLIEEKKLLPELWQLVQAEQIFIQPLKERLDDVEPLAEYFANKLSCDLGLPLKKIGKTARKLLKKYLWPQNVFELQTLILHALLDFDAPEIEASHLQLRLDQNWIAHADKYLEKLSFEEMVEMKLSQFMERLGRYDAENIYDTIIDRVERPLIRTALEKAGGNQLRAAKILGINRNTLRAKIGKYELE